MPGRTPPPLRWFSAADIEAAMPPVEERLRLAELTLTALAEPERAQLPAKIGIHPRSAGSFGHAMPAHLRGADIVGDLVGMKWVTGYSANLADGLPAINAVVVLNDAATGIPVALLDGGPITAQRTAAVTGLVIRRFGPEITGRAVRVALIGAGTQGHSHAPVIGHVLPGAELRIFDRDAGRAVTLAASAAARGALGGVSVAASAREAIDGADVVVTAASFLPPDERQSMTSAWLAPGATVVPVDYDTYCAAAVARDASLFLVDHSGQFLANRDGGGFFAGYPDPGSTIGEAILAGTPRPAGRVVVTHLGVGLADVVFADAIVRAAVALGLGMTLVR